MATEPLKPKPHGSPTTTKPLVVNLQVVSPSVGVNRPLLFPDLPATTTIKQLKDMIRQMLPLRPADDNQRLIHRGRALLRDSDRLLDVFGADALRTPHRQTIHLVIRDTSEDQTTRASRLPSPSTLGQVSSAVRMPRQTPLSHTGAKEQATSSSLPRRPVPVQMSQPRTPSPAPLHFTNEQTAAAFQQQHQPLTTWFNQVQMNAQFQREAMLRFRVSQGQRGRGQMGRRGAGDAASGHEVNGIISPGTANTIHYETVGPNGLTYYVDTVVRASSVPQAGLSPQDVNNILRVADANQATLAITNAMQQSASGPPLSSRPPHHSAITAPTIGSGVPLDRSGRATPDLELRSIVATNSGDASPSPTQLASCQVYIVMSPEGPRALLFNHAASDSYFTPRLRAHVNLPLLRSTPSISTLAITSVPSSSHQDRQTIVQQDHDQGQVPNEPAGAAFVPPRPVQVVHANNHEAGGFPPLLLQFWPHIWLVFRLGLFVWFFTSPNSSWSRWFTIVCLAILMFVLSTGLLNGVVESIWRPIGRHLDNILPGPGQQQQQHLMARDAGAVGLNQDAQPAADERDGTPEQMTARLVVQHQARRGWLADQVRRLERAGLLFLASLAPGVAERHIANLEAEVQAAENRPLRDAETEVAADEAGDEANTTSLNDDGSSSVRGHGGDELGEQASDIAHAEDPRREGDELAL